MENCNSFTCPICGNTDIHSIGYLNGKPYCRRCISFRGKEADEPIIEPKNADYKLSYHLSNEQKALSKKLVQNYKDGKNSLVKAVCGSGKTEIVLSVISLAIKKGQNVGFAVPRRDVAIELYMRFKEIFVNNKVCLLYGGHTDDLTGDLICLTSHQLFRYEKYFDLLIMDEIDAFPFKGNDVLNAFFDRSIRGHYILLSATPDNEFVNSFKKKGGDVLELYTRFHKHPLPVPMATIKNVVALFFKLVRKIKEYLNQNKPIFIFTPTIEICERVFNLLNILIKGGSCVHSKKSNRNAIINNFKKGKYRFLVTTAVLERGVTVKDLQVIIFLADHNIYDRYSLIQIAGRVGRKKEAPTGEVIFLAREYTKEMDEAIKDIQNSNKKLQNLL